MTSISEALQKLLMDHDVTEIMIDGPSQVYIERNGKLENVDVCFAGEDQILSWANGLLSQHGLQPVDEAHPWVEHRLPNGDYVLVITRPVAVSGPCVVIMRPTRAPFGFRELVEWGCLSPAMLDFFEIVMQAKVSMLISGGSSSGKTTLARMIVELTPPAERLVIVGETGLSRILQVQHERMVNLEPPASGEITASELLRLTRHMRPDRIVYGELEGSEALEVLKLANRGHDGMLTTIHAESPRDALYRLETMITTAEPGLTLPAIRAQIAGALGLIVQQNLLEDGTRKVTSICEVQGIKGETIILQELFTWAQSALDADGRIVGTHKATGAIPSFASTLAAAGLTFPDGTFEP